MAPFVLSCSSNTRSRNRGGICASDDALQQCEQKFWIPGFMLLTEPTTECLHEQLGDHCQKGVREGILTAGAQLGSMVVFNHN